MDLSPGGAKIKVGDRNWSHGILGVLQHYLPIGDISMLFNRLVSLRDHDRLEVIYAKNLPRNSPASCLTRLRGLAGFRDAHLL